MAHADSTTPMEVDPVAPTLSEAPAGVNISIPATPFAPAYNSIHFKKILKKDSKTLACLKHVNCNYLSTKGLAPTLNDLKQHAHSLAVLIKEFTTSTRAAIVDNENAGTDGAPLGETFEENETYDWLNNLSKPYVNHDRHHQMPLHTLLNTLDEFDDEDRSLVEVCALFHAQHLEPSDGRHSQPYATREALIKHANEIFELLDHDLGAKGGLLSILPTVDQVEDRKKAEATLLGQFILYVQRLVQRLHDLERQYANAMDVIHGEAIHPHQMLSRLGPEGRKERPVVYPQDRFVLVNAGDDVWDYLNIEFNQKEIEDKKKDERMRSLGLTGEAFWKTTKNGKEFAQGITAIDVTTRYYRLRNDPLKTIFLIPAYQVHPGTAVTREMESKPTVVSVVKPVWPERSSVLEQKQREEMKELQRLRRDNVILVEKETCAQEEVRMLDHDNKVSRATIKSQEATIAELNSLLYDPENTARMSIMKQVTAANTAREETMKREQQLRDEIAKLQGQSALWQKKHDSLELHIAAQKQNLERSEALSARRFEKLQNYDEDLAIMAHDMQDKFKATWKKQLEDTAVLGEMLRFKETGQVLGGTDQEVSTVALKRGVKHGTKKADEVLAMSNWNENASRLRHELDVDSQDMMVVDNFGPGQVLGEMDEISLEATQEPLVDWRFPRTMRPRRNNGAEEAIPGRNVSSRVIMASQQPVNKRRAAQQADVISIEGDSLEESTDLADNDSTDYDSGP